MSDDLISRKALLEEIQSFRCSITGLRAGKGIIARAADEYQKSILHIIEDQPASFDKEKVIEDLNDRMKDAGKWAAKYDEVGDTGNMDLQDMAARCYKNAIEIVEKGGIE